MIYVVQGILFSLCVLGLLVWVFLGMWCFETVCDLQAPTYKRGLALLAFTTYMAVLTAFVLFAQSWF